MATPTVNWRYPHPWSTSGPPLAQQSATATALPSVAETPGRAQAYQSLINQYSAPTEGGFGGVPGGMRGTGITGPMNEGMERSMGLRGAMTLGQAAVFGNPYGALPGLGALAMAAISRGLREAGVAQEYDPTWGLDDPAIQATRDIQGQYAADAMQAQQRAALNEAFVREMGQNIPGGVSPGGGSTGDPGAESAGFGGAEGGVSTGGGYDFARGGSVKLRRPTRILAGEREDEQVIAIPQSMRRPGMQGRERQVRRGLKSAYSSLTGGQFKAGG